MIGTTINRQLFPKAVRLFHKKSGSSSKKSGSSSKKSESSKMFQKGKDFIEQFKKTKEEFKKKFEDTKEKLEAQSENIKESFKEVSVFCFGSLALKTAHDCYINNSDDLTVENTIKKTQSVLSFFTIPSDFNKKPISDARLSILDSLENIGHSQDNFNHVRKVTSQLSPAFTIMPILAKPAFAVTIALSTVDVVNILCILRVKEMVEIHSDIIPKNKNEEYQSLLSNIEQYIPRAMLFDALKIFYRGQLAAVNRQLKLGEKPETNYKFPVFNAFSTQRLLPTKANLPLVSWILPTSYCISDLSAKDTQDLTDNINKLIEFFKNIDVHSDTEQAKGLSELPQKIQELENKKNESSEIKSQNLMTEKSEQD
jgi:hypothetical protein